MKTLHLWLDGARVSLPGFSDQDQIRINDSFIEIKDPGKSHLSAIVRNDRELLVAALSQSSTWEEEPDVEEEVVEEQVEESVEEPPPLPGPPPPPVQPEIISGPEPMMGVDEGGSPPPIVVTSNPSVVVVPPKKNKPGYKTTEFWITGLTIIGATVSGVADVLPEKIAAGLVAGASLAYMGARTLLKMKSGMVITPPEESK